MTDNTEKIIEALKAWEKCTDPKVSTQLIMQKKIGRGDNGIILYHNLNDGNDYNSLPDATKDQKSTIILKRSAPGYKEPKIVFPGVEVPLRIACSTASDLYGIVYENFTIKVDGEELKFMAIQYCCLDIRAIKKDTTTRVYQRIAAFYVDEQKNIYSSNWSGVMGVSENYRDAFISFSFWLLPNLNYLNVGWNDSDKDLLEVCNFMGWSTVTLGGNTRKVLDRYYDLSDFLKYKEPMKRTGPKQKHIDELVSMPIEDYKTPKYNKLEENDRGSMRFFSNLVKVENDNTPIVCLRTFIMLKGGEISEGARIYIEPGKFTACKKTSRGDWVNVSLGLDNHHFAYPVTYTNKDALKGTILEYVAPMLNDIEGKAMGTIIAGTLRHPCIENLYKSEFKKIIKEGAERTYTNIWGTLQNQLGELNEKGKSVYNITGFNKKQIVYVDELLDKFHDEELSQSIPLFRALKESFNTNTLKDIDMETFKTVADAMYDMAVWAKENRGKKIEKDGYKEELSRCYYYQSDMVYIFNKISKNWKLVTLKSMVPKVLELMKYYEWESYMGYNNVMRYRIKTYINTYRDYLNMINEMNATGLTPHFQSYEHITIMHDDILPSYNYFKQLERAKENEERLAQMSAKWESRIKFWKKWQYSNENYTVVIPQQPIELTNEGINLGHCVGSYIDRVINHKTNIVFIRRTDNLEKSLFTVEISNEGYIEQIHGVRNCCITDTEVVAENPTIGKFVDDWEANTKLKSSKNFNKVR